MTLCTYGITDRKSQRLSTHSNFRERGESFECFGHFHYWAQILQIFVGRLRVCYAWRERVRVSECMYTVLVDICNFSEPGVTCQET